MIWWCWKVSKLFRSVLMWRTTLRKWTDKKYCVHFQNQWTILFWYLYLSYNNLFNRVFLSTIISLKEHLSSKYHDFVTDLYIVYCLEGDIKLSAISSACQPKIYCDLDMITHLDRLSKQLVHTDQTDSSLKNTDKSI